MASDDECAEGTLRSSERAQVGMLRRVPPACAKPRLRKPCGGQALRQGRPSEACEGPRLRAATHFGVQARALARGASLLLIVQGVRREGTLQRIATKSIPQSFQGQNVFRGNIPQIDVGTKPKDKELLLILDRSFPL